MGDINFEKAMEFLKRGDVAGAVRAAERASEFGHPRAEELLAMTTHLARLEGLLKRADRDDPDALYELAVIRIVGLGLESRDLDGTSACDCVVSACCSNVLAEGIALATKAWDRARHEKAGGIVTLVDENLSVGEQVMALLRYLSDQGAPEAQLELAGILLSGDAGDFTVPPDASEGQCATVVASAEVVRL